MNNRRRAVGVLVVGLTALFSGCTQPITPPVISAGPLQPSPPAAGAPDGLGARTATPSPTASPSPTTDPDSLEAAFASPETGGIGGFLKRHRDWLPATVNVGDEVLSGASSGSVDLAVRVPANTGRIYMSIACTAPASYRMEVLRDGTSLGASWADSCGYWGGLHGYTTAAFDPANPPNRLKITVDSNTKYSFVLYAVPAQP